MLNEVDFGATPDAAGDDTTPIQEAINAAALKTWGDVVYFPAGTYIISHPLYLPRTGSNAQNAVQLLGDGHNTSVIRAVVDNFPQDRALIEWDTTTRRALNQSIKGISFTLPATDGIRAIHYKLSVTPSIGDDLNLEILSIVLEDITIVGFNDHQEDFIRLEGKLVSSQ